jgi:DedD protein
MGLLSLFQRKTPGTGEARPGDEVQRARSRARQRLIGAVLLVGIGIVGFPLLFETHPRPIPVDIPIEIANKDKAPPLVMPPVRPNAASAAESPAPGPAAPASAGVITESASDAGREVAAPTARAAPETAHAAPSKADAVSKTPAPSPGRDDAARARAAPEARAAAKDESRAVADGRFVVQVGAFAEASTAREARQRVEKLGLKTYTQDVDTAAGRRIRVRIGPFGSRDEADRVVGKLKSAGLPAALLTL